MTLVTKLPIVYKIYVGEGFNQRVYSGEPTYILGIVRYLKDNEKGMLFTITRTSEKVISIRALKGVDKKATNA